MIARNKHIITVRPFKSTYGDMVVGEYEGEICLIGWRNGAQRHTVDHMLQHRLNAFFEMGTTTMIEETIVQLEEYFRGERRYFDIPLKYVGTEFQLKVWNELLHIPYGKTISYTDLAVKLGREKSARAVATACSRNPITIIGACHRVIGSNGKMIGYDGGVEVLRALLKLEEGDLSLFPISDLY